MTHYALAIESICLLILECFKTYFRQLCAGVISSVQCSTGISACCLSLVRKHVPETTLCWRNSFHKECHLLMNIFF